MAEGPGAQDCRGGLERPVQAARFQVARLIADGLTNKQIAEQLALAPKTISAHVAHILTKLGCRPPRRDRSLVRHHPSRQPSPRSWQLPVVPSPPNRVTDRTEQCHDVSEAKEYLGAISKTFEEAATGRPGRLQRQRSGDDQPPL
jgi:hypothetical protein